MMEFRDGEIGIYDDENIHDLACGYVGATPFDGRFVSMTYWHWWVLYWTVQDIGYPLSQIIEDAEKIAKEGYGFEQSLKWWLEISHRARLEIEEHGQLLAR